MKKTLVALSVVLASVGIAHAQTSELVIYNKFSMPVDTVHIGEGDLIVPIQIPVGVSVNTLQILSHNESVLQLINPQSRNILKDGELVTITLKGMQHDPIIGAITDEGQYYSVYSESSKKQVLISKSDILLLEKAPTPNVNAKVRLKDASEGDSKLSYTYQYDRISYDGSYSLTLSDEGSYLSGSYVVSNHGEGNYSNTLVTFVNSGVDKTPARIAPSPMQMKSVMRMESFQDSSAQSKPSTASAKTLSVYQHPERVDISEFSSTIIPIFSHVPVKAHYEYSFSLPSFYQNKNKGNETLPLYSNKSVYVKNISSEMTTLPSGSWRIMEDGYMSGIVNKSEVSTSNPVVFSLGASSNVSMLVDPVQYNVFPTQRGKHKANIEIQELKISLKSSSSEKVNVKIKNNGFIINENSYAALREMLYENRGRETDHAFIQKFLIGANIPLSELQFNASESLTLYQIK